MKGVEDDLQAFGLNNWKDRGPIYSKEKGWSKSPLPLSFIYPNQTGAGFRGWMVRSLVLDMLV